MIFYDKSYVESHTLEFDIQYSMCGSCNELECKYYLFGECPYEEDSN